MFVVRENPAEMGYFRIVMGHNALGIETEIAWATPGVFTIHNFPCNEDSSNCGGNEVMASQKYVDPSTNPSLLIKQRNL